MKGDTRWISIRLANGEHYTIFEHGDWNSRRLLLTPASENQDEADIEFYCHSSGASKPIRIGVIKFASLPVGDVELSLEAKLASEGTLSVTIRHEASGRVENLEMRIPGNGIQRSSSERVLRTRRGMRWFLGVLYVTLSLAIVFWLVWLVTDWGEHELLPPPISRSVAELSVV